MKPNESNENVTEPKPEDELSATVDAVIKIAKILNGLPSDAVRRRAKAALDALFQI